MTSEKEKDMGKVTMRHELDKKVKRYILDCIDGSAYGADIEASSSKDKIEFLRKTFEEEYGYEIQRQGRQAALEDWYRGLPSACSLEYLDHKILELARDWGSLPENSTEVQERKILNGYWGMMAAKTAQLFDGYRVPKEGEE